MSTTNTSSSGGGVGLSGLLFIVFLILKLTHVINWSWWWVTAPLWMGLVLFLVFAAIAFLAFQSVTSKMKRW